MSFRSISWKFLIGVLLCLSACSDYLSSGKVKKQAVKINKEDFACMEKVPVQWRNYFNDKAAPGEMVEMASCVDHAITSYKQNVSGELEDSYTQDDLLSFFNFFYFESNQIDRGLVAEFFKLKRLLVGGSEEVLTTRELNQLNDLTRGLAEEMEFMRPSIGIITMKRKSEPSPSEVNFALLSMRDSLMRFLAKTKITEWAIDVQDFDGLINRVYEWGHRYDGSLSGNKSESAWFRLLNSVYGIIEGDKKIAGQQEWDEFLNSAAKLYRPVVLKHYYLRDGRWKQRKQIRNVEGFIFGIIDFFETSPLMSRQGGVDFKYTDSLLDSIYEIYPNDLGISKHSMIQAYKALISKKVSSLDDPMRGQWDRIDKAHIKIMKRELNLWRNIQNFIGSLKYEPNLDSLPGWISQEAVKKAFDDYKGPTLGEFGHILNRSWPTMVDDGGHLVIDHDMHLKPYTWNSLSFINLTRAMSRFLMLGYGHLESGSHANEDLDYLDLWQAKLLQPELAQWFDDFKDLGIEIKAFDSRNSNSGSRTFREINFFTFSGNGDSTVDLNELHEYLTGVFAGGANSLREMREGAVKAGCEVPELDEFREHWLEEKCFKSYLKHNLGSLFPGLIQLKRLRYVRQLMGESDKSWDSFYSSLMNGARVSDPRKNLVETGDIRNFIAMMQYSETILIYFDVDRDGLLSKAELLTASRRFYSFLREATCQSNESILSEGFTYLVLRGEMPTALALAKYWFSGQAADIRNWGKDAIDAIVGVSDRRTSVRPGGEKPVGREQIYNVFSLLKLRLEQMGKPAQNSSEGATSVCIAK